MNIKEYVYVSLLTAAAVVMGIIESSLPPFFAFAPGAKVGLANLVMIIAVFTLRWRQVWVMQILRLLITALFTGFSVFLPLPRPKDRSHPPSSGCAEPSLPRRFLC